MQNVSSLRAKGIHPISVLDMRIMKGSQDSPKILRIKESYTHGYAKSTFDEGRFIAGRENQKLQSELAEGKPAGFAYLGPKTISRLLAVKSRRFLHATIIIFSTIFRKYSYGPSNIRSKMSLPLAGIHSITISITATNVNGMVP